MSSPKPPRTKRKAAKSSVTMPPPSGSKHVQLAMDYIKQVLSGERSACKLVHQACARQLDDLRRFKDHPIYYWDEEKAGRVCRFIERLPHVKGPKAKPSKSGEEGLIVLEGWQCFILTTVFGWRRRDKNSRRFRRVYIEVPRGNAKSTLSSGVGAYCLGKDDEQGAEIYSAATKKDQAKIVFDVTRKMLEKRPEFSKKAGFEVNAFDIQHRDTNSKFIALSRDSDGLDGLNVHLAVIDELHAHKDRGIYDVVETGCGKRPSSLLWCITTAGSDTSGICYEVRRYCLKVLDGTVKDESQFAIVYTIDEGDDWTELSTWIKANPNWDVSVDVEAFTQLAMKAIQVVSAQSNFKTKHLNIWCNSDSPWMDMAYWHRCADPNLNEEDFINSTDECYMSVDLASRTDIAARGKLYVRHQKVPEERKQSCARCARKESEHLVEERGCTAFVSPGDVEPHYYLFMDCYLPEDAVMDGRNASYEGWAGEGWIKTTPGATLDFNEIKRDIIADASRAHVISIAYDPWQAAQMATELTDIGLEMIEVRPTVAAFSAPMKELDALVRMGRLHHNGNPCLEWQVSNVVCHTDAKDNIYPRKEKPEFKIDAVVAAIMSMSRAMFAGDNTYESRGMRQL